jgi:ribonuclease HI
MQSKSSTTESKSNTTIFNEAASILDIKPLHHIAFTDGSCYPNNKSNLSRGGYAAVFVSGEFDDKCIYGNLDISIEHASNIRAEGMAIIRVLEIVRDCEEKWDKLTIVTDCEFWINMLTKYIPKWKKGAFNEKANPDMTKKIWIAYNEVKEKGIVKLMHMRSHNKDGWNKFPDGTFEKYCFEQNDYVDKMCGYARINLKPTDESFDDVEY